MRLRTLALLAAPLCCDAAWKLTFEDEFDTLDLSTWSVKDGYTHTWPDTDTTELQLYVKDEVFVENGSLVLQTRYRPDVVRSYGHSGKNFTSGWIDSSLHGLGGGRGRPQGLRASSSGGFSQLYGRFEWRARLPPGAKLPTIWPALWMMPEPTKTVPADLCWPAGGEIDVMEMWGGRDQSQMAATVHWTQDGGAAPTVCNHANDRSSGHAGVFPDVQHGAPAVDLSAAFHTYAVEWNASALVFFVDGGAIGARAASQIHMMSTPFYVIMNTAICGASWCDTGDMPHTTTRMEVDYVRVYEWAADATAAAAAAAAEGVVVEQAEA